MTNKLFSRLSKILSKSSSKPSPKLSPKLSIEPHPSCTSPSTCNSSAGKIITVKSGDTIPCNGEVIDGFATVDESAIVGVSTPAMIDSSAGRNQVLADTTVVEGTLTIRCAKNGGKQRSN